MSAPSLYEEFGVTEQMIEDHGQAIFDLSHNIQIRTRDPYRTLDWDQIEASRADMGLTDDQIADKLELNPLQVRFIRTIIESRRFRTGHYRRLYDLGGGKRYRPERQN